MKIAIISSFAPSLLNFRGPLMREMVKRGHEVIAFAPDFKDESRNALAAMGIEAVDYSMSRSGTNPIREAAVIFQLSHLLRIHKPDVTLSYFIKPVIYASIAATLARVPRIFSLYAGLGSGFSGLTGQNQKLKLMQSALISLARISANWSTHLIFQNSADREDLVKLRVAIPDKCTVVGATGLDLAEWLPAPFPDKPLTYILVGRLLRDKGIHEYIAAARILRADYPALRFLILGDLDDNPGSINRVDLEAWLDEGLIEWPGHVAVKPWLANAHVFVLPSYYREGVPRSTQEAMAMGRPIVTADAPGCRETVIHGHNGFMVPPRNHVALAAAMRHFIENPQDIETMGARSREIACQRFDVHAQNKKILGIMGI